MPMTPVQMIDSLKGMCGVRDDTDWDDPKCLLLINRSLWFLTSNFDFRQLEDRKTDFSLTIDQVEYTLAELGIPSIDYIRTFAVLNEQGQSKTLKQMSIQKYQDLYTTQELDIPEGTFLNQIPEFYVRDGAKIFFWPVPKIAANMVISTYATIDDYTADDRADLPQNWDEIILWGAVQRGFDDLGDVNRAAIFENRQSGAVALSSSTKSKELKDTRDARIQLPPRTSASWRN